MEGPPPARRRPSPHRGQRPRSRTAACGTSLPCTSPSQGRPIHRTRGRQAAAPATDLKPVDASEHLLALEGTAIDGQTTRSPAGPRGKIRDLEKAVNRVA